MSLSSAIAFVFPGQGSQAPAMLGDFGAKETVVLQTFAEASAALGYDLWDLIQNGAEADLNKTETTQPALLTAGVSIWRLWNRDKGILPDYMAGHSLGEYTALVCAGSLDFSDAVTLVRDRGRYMQEAVPEGAGAMAAILGLDSLAIETLCTQAAEGAVVSAANYNSPEQTVIAGDSAAVARAIELAKAIGAKRAIMLPVSVPSHCLLMRSAAERLADRLDGITVRESRLPVIQNVDAKPHVNADEIKNALVEQLYRPVRWVDTIRQLKQFKCNIIIESAPGKVLTGLIKRIDTDIETTPVHNVDTFEQTVKKYSL